MTEFHFMRGSWKPPVKVMNCTATQPNGAEHHAAVGDGASHADATASAHGFVMRDGIAIPDHVLRTQAAMGCPFGTVDRGPVRCWPDALPSTRTSCEAGTLSQRT